MVDELIVALWRLEAERPDKPCSLARLSKQAGLPMSVLRRQLTLLEEAGLVTLELDDGGITGTVHFSPDGRALAADMMG
ncbi:helix-turn-helix domain-containing protein [Duganella sp. PWIR1]